TTDGCLGRDVSHHESAGRAAEAAVRDERDGLAQTAAHQGRRDAEHLAHAGAAAGSLVADHHHVAGGDAAVAYCRECVLFAVEHARGTGMARALVTGGLHHRSVRSEIAPQDVEAARRLERSGKRAEHFLTWRLGSVLGVLAPGFAVHHARKSTRLNSSHRTISYAVFCLKKKKKKKNKRIKNNKK